MQIDELILKLKSDFNKVVSDANSLISKFTKLDNSTSKVSNDFEKMSKSASSIGNGFKSAEENISQLKMQLNSLKSTYKADLEYFNMNNFVGSSGKVFDRRGLTDEQKRNMEIPEGGLPKITKESLEERKALIDELQAKVDRLQKSETTPKTQDGIKNVKQLGDETDKTAKKFDKLKNKSKQTSGLFSRIGNIFGGLGNKFKDATKDLSKGLDKNFKSLKKLGLGLVGVRTVMSLLTKSVNAYLSFDSELQDSLTNSWNMLGSLLAPAIELVANLFATATNYIYRFVQALTGIDLVARANAKSLQTQAKATQKAAAAQRGLLAMDEITNLPTEPGGGGDAAQIKVGDIDTKGIFSDLIEAFKQHKWHRAGEIIAEGINQGLRKINWDLVREKAESTGRNIADFLNGVFELDWRLLGSSMANAINTAIDFVYGFVTKLEWGRIGVGIGDALTSFFKTFDINKLADSISAMGIGIFNMFTATLVHIDVQEVSNKIIDFFERLKWVEIAQAVTNFFVVAIEKAFQLRFNIFDRLLTDLTSYLRSKVNSMGNTLGERLANGFKGGFRAAFNILIATVNNMIQPVKRLISNLGKIAGRNISLGDVKIPYLETGTNEIISEGLYHLHEGEAVVPKRYNPATDGYDNSKDNRQIIDLLISLNANMLEYAERPININMSSKKVAEATYDDLQQISRNKNISNVVVRS